MILLEADLVSPSQIKVALQDQTYKNKKKSVNEKWQTNFEQNNDELSDTKDFEITWIG